MANKVDNGSKNYWWQSAPAWLAVIVTMATLSVTLWTHSHDEAKAAHERLVEHRREALFNALKIIDAVYSNMIFYEKPPMHPVPVDLQQARDADNQMRIYCEYPETILAFRKALGFWNPYEGKGAAPHPDVGALDEFRVQIAKELDLPPPVGSDPRLAWIANLEGTATSQGK